MIADKARSLPKSGVPWPDSQTLGKVREACQGQALKLKDITNIQITDEKCFIIFGPGGVS